MMRLRRFVGFIFLRNLVSAILVGLLTGLLIGSLWPPKKEKSTDVILGIIGAILGGLFLAFLGGGARLVSALIFQFIGALIVILLNRLLAG